MKLAKIVLLALPVLLVSAPAEAVKLRRPFSPAVSRNYGYDNNGSAGGCTDYACKGACYNTHSGTDFPVPLGTDILAAADGKVVAVNNSCADWGFAGNSCGGYCGNYVKIRHADGDETLYCHMKKGSFVVSVGSTVGCGQKIGRSASSGSSTGPHVHLAVAAGGGRHVDAYSGPCTSSKGYWVNPGSYGSPVGTACAVSDKDRDGIADSRDNCPTVANKSQTDTDKDGRGDACDPDDDNDGVLDVKDNCDLVKNKTQTDVDKDGKGDACDDDIDADGLLNAKDNCPYVKNADQLDTDKDGKGNACETDDDNDGVVDTVDNCKLVKNPEQDDLDGDGKGDECDDDLDGDKLPNDKDNCREVANADQQDADEDGVGDACDDDSDGDGIPNDTDLCPSVADEDQDDSDGDGKGDACDDDSDGDGIPNDKDNCATIANADQADADGNGMGDACQSMDGVDGDPTSHPQAEPLEGDVGGCAVGATRSEGAGSPLMLAIAALLWTRARRSRAFGRAGARAG